MSELLRDEPHGWRELCAKIQDERDGEKLKVLIAQVNALLAEHEQRNKRF